jgi:hypothetical protein
LQSVCEEPRVLGWGREAPILASSLLSSNSYLFPAPLRSDHGRISGLHSSLRLVLLWRVCPLSHFPAFLREGWPSVSSRRAAVTHTCSMVPLHSREGHRNALRVMAWVLTQHLSLLIENHNSSFNLGSLTVAAPAFIGPSTFSETDCHNGAGLSYICGRRSSGIVACNILVLEHSPSLLRILASLNQQETALPRPKPVSFILQSEGRDCKTGLFSLCMRQRWHLHLLSQCLPSSLLAGVSLAHEGGAGLPSTLGLGQSETAEEGSPTPTPSPGRSGAPWLPASLVVRATRVLKISFKEPPSLPPGGLL